MDKTKRDKAKAELLTGGTLFNFMCPPQNLSVIQIIDGDEGDYMADTILALADRVKNMPVTYGQDGKGKDAIVYLHYFFGGFDAWVTEKDKSGDEEGENQHQAYGFQSFGGFDQAEAGYISIVEILATRVRNSWIELDLHWTPKPFKECKQ